MLRQCIIHSLLVAEFDKSHCFLLLIIMVDWDLDTYYLYPAPRDQVSDVFAQTAA